MADQTTAPYRVLMIAPTSFFADYGCHVRILEEARALQELGHAVTIVTYHNGGDAPGLDIRRSLPVPGRGAFEVGSSRHKIAFDALLGARIVPLLADGQYDVIHGHLHEGALMGLVLGRFFRVPMVFDFQGSMTGEMLDHGFLRQDGRLYRPLRGLERWIDRKAPAIFTSSANARAVLLEQFDCCEDRVFVLPDAVNATKFRPATAYDCDELRQLRAQIGVPIDRKLLVYLGLLAEYQGTGLLLEGMARLLDRRKDAHLLLMGFPNVDRYRQQAHSLGIGEHVTLTGRVPYDEAPRMLALGDVAVSTKLSLTEGAGKLLNYMAVGLPTVVFDTRVAREYLGEAGIYVTPAAPDALAAALEHAMFPAEHEASNVRALGLRLRERAVNCYRWDTVARQIIDAYWTVLREPSEAYASSSNETGMQRRSALTRRVESK